MTKAQLYTCLCLLTICTCSDKGTSKFSRTVVDLLVNSSGGEHQSVLSCLLLLLAPFYFLRNLASLGTNNSRSPVDLVHSKNIVGTVVRINFAKSKQGQKCFCQKLYLAIYVHLHPTLLKVYVLSKHFSVLIVFFLSYSSTPKVMCALLRVIVPSYALHYTITVCTLYCDIRGPI